MNTDFIAHTSPDGRIHYVSDHLYHTSQKAQEMAGEFGCGEWGKVAGLWHDIGKYSPEFQAMIAEVARNAQEPPKHPSHVDHSTAGAIYSIKKLGKTGRVLSYVIAGHHAGLPDWLSEDSGRASLAQRLQNKGLLDILPSAEIPPDIINPLLSLEKPRSVSDGALWIRMLFSCLVDADFMDTEAFVQPEKTLLRSKYPDLSDLLPLFSAFMHDKSHSVMLTPINRLRKEILDRCIEMAATLPGIFTLTVPTGGGKTLSSMAFALHHALQFKKKRIIYVIPYTSIIEQTADQFRQIFGDAVIEHHSNLDPTSEDADSYNKHLLACENWDAPIIVTTSVQFFESLFSSRSSRCRKLHNIINSVVILDEAQLVPPNFLNPIIKGLTELQKSYGVTIVLSTATQPALSPRKSIDFNFDGIPEMTEIVNSPAALHDTFKRVSIHIPADLNQAYEWNDVAQNLIQHPSVLCLVNRRDDARKLYSLMPHGTIHLSALMCGAHRSEVIHLIKERLNNCIPTRVISTQLVEAGVDIDFPVVYRALAGLDSIAQAAGRCNREGKLEQGQVYIFVPPTEAPAGHLRQAAGISRRLLTNNITDPLIPQMFEHFFEELYWLKGDRLDSKAILKDLANDPQLRFSFRTAAAKFRIIDDTQQLPVIVRYGKGIDLIELLRKTGPDRWLLRRLQRYIVNLPKNIHMRLLAEGSISELYPGTFIQEIGAHYDSVLGFCADKSCIYEPDELII